MRNAILKQLIVAMVGDNLMQKNTNQITRTARAKKRKTMNEFEYYQIATTGEPNVPLLKNNDAVDPNGTDVLYLSEYADVDSPIYLALNSTAPPKPNFNADLYTLPSAVYSQKIYDILSPLNIKGYQLIPGIIVDKKGEEHKGFWLENAYTRIICLDLEASGATYRAFGDTWGNFKRIVLNNDLLKEIPLKERLIFRPKETREFVLYHKSIVDAIMAVNPVNIRFIPVDEWDTGVAFR